MAASALSLAIGLACSGALASGDGTDAEMVVAAYTPPSLFEARTSSRVTLEETPPPAFETYEREVVEQPSVQESSAVPVSDVMFDGAVDQPVPAVPESDAPPDGENAPVDFTADSLTHDETGQILTAMGDVELVQNGRILKADKMTYDLAQDRVMAHGNVVLSEPTGDTYFGDEVEIRDEMKDGFVVGLRGMLADGSRFTAKEGERIGGTKLVLKDATYTPCEPCKADPSRPPLWQLRASKVTHDKEDQTISYKNATFELAGVPIAYTPYLSHADGTVDRKSGFLMPSAGFDSQLGAFYTQNYYWDIAPNKDATMGAIVSTDLAPVALGEYRHRFEDAELKLSGSLTYSDRIDSSGIRQDEDIRGHIHGEGLWNMNERWRSGLRLNVASDDQYLRQYDLDGDLSNDDKHNNVLENELYAERFEGRNYTVIRAMGFQDTRVSDRATDQPAVLPEVITSYYGDPNGLLGGRWNVEASTLGLYRDGDGQDVARGSLEGGWETRMVSPIGLVSTLDLLARGDLYYVGNRDVDVAGAGQDNQTSQGRGFAQAHFQTSYPFVNNLETSQIVLEPLAALTVGTNVTDDSDIPNEDSQDVYLDSLKLFEPNRFSGLDRIEDRSRVTYGLRSGWYSDAGSKLEVFFGQSRRFDDQNNPFPEGSGLSDQESDYVGQITADIGSYLDLDYRFQLENKNMSSQRHEFIARSQMGPLDLSTRYFYANALEGTDFTESREQIRNAATLKLNDQWSVNTSMRYDFGEFEGLRSFAYGVDYTGQCITLSVLGQRRLTRETSGDSETELMFRIGLKNLGEIQTSGVSLGGSND